MSYATRYATKPTPQIRIPTGHPDETLVNAARRWKSENENSYRKLAMFCIRESNRLNDAKSNQKVHLRRIRYSNNIFYSNSLDAPLARELEYDFPELEGRMDIRRSRTDGYKEV